MAQFDVTAHNRNAAAQKSQVRPRLGLPELQKSGSACMNPTQMAKEFIQAGSDSKPSHDLSTAKVIDLVEKRLKWIHRTDLHVGRINWHENNHYAIELIGADRCPIYFVHVDAGEGQFFWSEAKEGESDSSA